jgi:hypothetical protein
VIHRIRRYETPPDDRDDLDPNGGTRIGRYEPVFASAADPGTTRYP